MTKREITVGIICILVALSIFYLTKDFPGFQARGVILPGPSFFPNFIACVLLGCGLVQILQGWRGKKDTAQQAASSVNRTGILIISLTCVAIVSYVLLLNRLGFQLLTYSFLVLTMLLLQVRPLKAAAYSLVVVCVMVLVFERIFHIPLLYGVFHL